MMNRIHGYVLMLCMAVWIASCATSQKTVQLPQASPAPTMQATPTPVLTPTVVPGAVGMQENIVQEATPRPLAPKPRSHSRLHAVAAAQAATQQENLLPAQSAEQPLDKQSIADGPQPAGTAAVATWTPTPVAMAGALQASRRQSSAGSPGRMLLGLLTVVVLGSLVVWARRSRDARDRGVVRMHPTAHEAMPKEQAIEKSAPAKPSLTEPASEEQPAAPAPVVKHTSHEPEAPKPMHHAAAEHAAPVVKKAVKKSTKTRTAATVKKSTAKKSNVISLRAQKQKAASAKTRKKAVRSQAEIVPFRKKANG